MLNDEILKALIEGIIYVAPEPVTFDSMVKVLEGEERERIKAKLEELVAEYEQNAHGIQIRQVANGYKFSTKAEHHEILRNYVKSLKPPVRLSKPALETLAVIAYRQPVTVPEIEEIRGVDSGGVIHTLLEKKLVVTSGRKSVVGRPILYRTSKDFLVHFGLKDVGELPSLKEFEELAKRALGSEWAGEAAPAPDQQPVTPSGEPAAAPAASDDVTAEPSAPAESQSTTEPRPPSPAEGPEVTAEVPPVQPAAESVSASDVPEAPSATPEPAPTPLPAEENAPSENPAVNESVSERSAEPAEANPESPPAPTAESAPASDQAATPPAAETETTSADSEPAQPAQPAEPTKTAPEKDSGTEPPEDDSRKPE
jgi:segregation and condensation protein B